MADQNAAPAPDGNPESPARAIALPQGRDGVPLEPERLRQLSDKELVRLLRESLDVTRQQILRAACVLQALADRGKDADWLIERHGFHPSQVGYLRGLLLIAAGRMPPECLLNYIDNRKVMQLVSALPLAEQERFVSGQGFPLRVFGPGGEKTERMTTARGLSDFHLRQMFAPDGHVRSLAEQDVWLEAQRARQLVLPRPPEKIGKIKLDAERRGCTIGKHFVPLDDLEAAVKALRKYLDGLEGAA